MEQNADRKSIDDLQLACYFSRVNCNLNLLLANALLLNSAAVGF